MTSSTTNRRGTGVRRGAVAALVAVAATSISVVLPAGPAHARCGGEGNPVTIVLRNSAGQAIARERPVSGTCNDNNTYTGQVQDSRTDGSCAYITIRDTITGPTIISRYECTTGNWRRFAFTDGDGSSWSVLATESRSIHRISHGF